MLAIGMGLALLGLLGRKQHAVNTSCMYIVLSLLSLRVLQLALLVQACRLE